MTPDQQMPVAVRLAALTPAETDNLAASSARQCGVELTEQSRSLGGAELPNGDRTPYRTVTWWTAKADTVEQVHAARRKVSSSLTPPDRDQAVGWLAELSVITARRMDDDMTEDLRAAAYSRRLADYPADIARHALLAHRWKFFPTWAEVADVCDELMQSRKKLLFALDTAEREVRDRDIKARALPTREAAVKTPEEKAEFAKSMADVIAEMGRRADAQDAEMEDRAARAAANFATHRPHAAE